MLKWEELQQDVNNDPLGIGIVMRKLSTANPVLERARMLNIVDTLFPSYCMTSRYLAKMNYQEQQTPYKTGKRLDQMEYH